MDDDIVSLFLIFCGLLVVLFSLRYYYSSLDEVMIYPFLLKKKMVYIKLSVGTLIHSTRLFLNSTDDLLEFGIKVLQALNI